jgi:dipeptidase E
MEDLRKLLLISNSFCFGKGYLEHCAAAIQKFLGPINNLVFIPYALKDWGSYTRIAREGFAKMGITVTGIDEFEFGSDHDEVVRDRAQAIFVGGGNTFRLLDTLYKKGLIPAIRSRVKKGMPYLGASAGANVAGPTIKTTNDMPIVCPPSFNALDIFPFQINPHFVDADPNSKHMGETREKRIAEFHEENDCTVIGLREGSWVVVEYGMARLEGDTGAKLFSKGIITPTEWGKNHPMNV